MTQLPVLSSPPRRGHRTWDPPLSETSVSLGASAKKMLNGSKTALLSLSQGKTRRGSQRVRPFSLGTYCEKRGSPCRGDCPTHNSHQFLGHSSSRLLPPSPKLLLSLSKRHRGLRVHTRQQTPHMVVPGQGRTIFGMISRPVWEDTSELASQLMATVFAGQTQD